MAAFQRAAAIVAQPVHAFGNVIQVRFRGALTSGESDFAKLVVIPPHDRAEKKQRTGGQNDAEDQELVSKTQIPLAHADGTAS